MNIDIDEKNKRLEFSETSIQDWGLLLGGDYSNWELIFWCLQSNVLPGLEKQRFNGGLMDANFYKTLIDHIKVSSNSVGCEDSINAGLRWQRNFIKC